VTPPKIPSHTEFIKADLGFTAKQVAQAVADTAKAAEKPLSQPGFKEGLKASFLNNLKVTIVYSNAMPEAHRTGCVPEHFTRLNPRAVQNFLAEHGAQNPQGAEGENTTLWVRTPSSPGGQEVVGTALRNLFPNGSLSQDGLRSFLASPAFQTLFSGGQLIPGGTLSLPAGELASLLMSFAVEVPSPEVAMAVFITQSLLPDLMAGNITRGALTAVLQELVQSDPSLGVHANEIMNALGEMLSFSGMSSMGEVETLLQTLAEIHSQQILQDHGEGASLEKFQQWTQNTALSNHPQAQGLGECLQGNLQSLNQVFSGLLRTVMGMLILNPQNQWPKAMPNEQFLSELGKLFAAQYEKRERKKEKKAAPKKKDGRTEERLKQNHENFQGLLGKGPTHSMA